MATELIPTGYGPRLYFDGNQEKYELWEMKFLGHMRIKKMYGVFLGAEEPTEANNALAFAQLIQYLDDRSLNLIMRDAPDNGRKALKILREHYLGKGKPRIIYLYTQLTSLQMAEDESVTDYLIRAETICNSLKTAGETISDSLLMAITMKGLPDRFSTFCTVMTQKEQEDSFLDYKVALKSFEEGEKYRREANAESNTVMQVKPTTTSRSSRTITCYTCGKPNHKSYECRKNIQQRGNNQSYRGKWCSTCKSPSHTDLECRRSKKKVSANDTVKTVNEDSEEHSFVFKVDHTKTNDNVITNVCNSVLVDCGATAHIVTSKESFLSMKDLSTENHTIELADGSRSNNVVIGKGNASISVHDKNGVKHDIVLENALYIPSYKQNIFSVQAAVKKGANVNFSPNSAELIAPDGTSFDIKQSGRLYYLNSLSSSEKVSRDSKDWHKVMGHCNAHDVLALENVVDGMKISDKSDFNCEICTLGKMPQFRSRKPDKKASKLFELVHCDLAGPIEPVAREGFKYCLMFVDDFSGIQMVYFLKAKSDTCEAAKKFLADISPFGQVKTLRSDNGTEFTCDRFESLLIENKIRHEFSAPYSPHQNGTVERGWRTVFDMARCLLIEAKLPKFLWTYAVYTSVYIRNRCLNRRLGITPFEALTGKKPNLSKMHIFGTNCFAYVQNRTKLEPRCEKGVFLGYDKSSPAYLVYFQGKNQVKRVRCVKFCDIVERDSKKPNVNQPVPNLSQNFEEPCENTLFEPVQDLDQNNENPNIPGTAQIDEQGTRKSSRKCSKPSYLEDYVTMVDTPSDENIDYLYMTDDFDTPKTFEQAMRCENSEKWVKAMEDEMNSLKENETFVHTKLPLGTNLIGGKWVYALKRGLNGEERYKARYVAKGYSQIPDIDYKDTFCPTARITSIRMLLQIAMQQNLKIHQMDVKTAFLNGPIDCELFVEQPKGFEKLGQNGEKLVWKLNKSLYGLKQSGRIWNLLLHDYLTEGGFKQSLTDMCVYTKQNHDCQVVLLVWVDDLLIAANDENTLRNEKQMLCKRFQMKDLGVLSLFLNIQFDFESDYVAMHQTRYIEQLLEKFKMKDCKSKAAPCELNANKLRVSDSNFLDDSTLFRQVVGSLIYLMTCTRPDICYSVSMLSQFLEHPTRAHLEWAKHVLRYLSGTKSKSLIFRKCMNTKLQGFSDSDWGNSEDRKSVSGYCFSLSPNTDMISWKTKKQPCVALSTCEAEYVALVSCIQEAKFLVQLYKDLTGNESANVDIFVDNQSAIALAKNPVQHQRSKHIDIKYHFIRAEIQKGCVQLQYVPSEENLADMFTKPATGKRLSKLFV